MKVSVYIRDVDEMEGLFVGHAEHSELDDVVAMFQRKVKISLLLLWFQARDKDDAA